MPLVDPTGWIADLLEPTIDGMGYILVRIEMTGGRKRRLQVMVERQDGAAMTIEDCADLSPALSAALDVADPIAAAYTLEVSSPGIDRPLTRLRDFDVWAGFEARVELNAPLDGRKKFQGRLMGLAGDEVRMAPNKASATASATNGGAGEVRLPFNRIARAKLILTDDLIAATQAPAS